MLSNANLYACSLLQELAKYRYAMQQVLLVSAQNGAGLNELRRELAGLCERPAELQQQPTASATTTTAAGASAGRGSNRVASWAEKVGGASASAQASARAKRQPAATRGHTDLATGATGSRRSNSKELSTADLSAPGLEDMREIIAAQERKQAKAEKRRRIAAAVREQPRDK